MGVKMRDICGRLKVAAHCFYHPTVLVSALVILIMGVLAALGARHFLRDISAAKREAFVNAVHIGMDEAFVPVLGRLSNIDRMIGDVELWEEEALNDLGSGDESYRPIFILERRTADISQVRVLARKNDQYLLAEGASNKILELIQGEKILFVNGNSIRDKYSYIVRKLSSGNVKLLDQSEWKIVAAAIPYDIMELTAPILAEVAKANAKITIESGGKDKTPILAFGNESKSLFRSTDTETFGVSIFDATFSVSIISPANVGLNRFERRAEILIGISTLVLILVVASIIVLVLAGEAKAVEKEKETEAKLKMKSEQLKTLLATAPMGVFISTIDGSQFVGNEIFRSLFKLPIGATRFDMWVEAIHPEDREEIKESFLRSCESGDPFDRQFRTEIGGETYLRHMRTSPVMVKGKVSYCIGTVQDITPSRSSHPLSEEKSKPKSDQEQPPPSVDRVNEALAAIAESVAACHQELKELRNIEPAKAIRQESHSEKTDKTPLTIKTRSTKLIAQHEIRKTSAYPQAILSKVLTLLQIKADANGVVLGMEIDSKAPIKLETSPHLLTQGLIEMVDSAISSRSSGRVTVVYGIKGEDPYFSIVEEPRTDNFASQTSSSSFFNVEYPSLDELSASTPTRVVRESRSGKGFITSVSLSGASSADLEEETTPNSSVLIVEERDDIREHFEKIVKDLGLRPVSAKNTPDAWTRLCSEPFQFVIVDTSLGELPKSLRSTENGQTLPIIGIKAGAKDRSSDNAFDLMVGEDCTSAELRAALEGVSEG